jgi:hypothetical protein
MGDIFNFPSSLRRSKKVETILDTYVCFELHESLKLPQTWHFTSHQIHECDFFKEQQIAKMYILARKYYILPRYLTFKFKIIPGQTERVSCQH